MVPVLCAAVLIASNSQFAEWGRETLQLIQAKFAIPGTSRYAEDATSEGPSKRVAFNWSIGVLLSAFNAAAAYDPSFRSNLRCFADSTRDYWNSAGPVPGFDVLPKASPVDRYYDDNAWMALALTETYDLLGDRKYLDEAKATLKFCLSGEDSKLGGGIYWHENEKKTKNTCSNAPVAAACLAIDGREHDLALVARAEEIYSWTKKTLQDPADHLMWDSIDVATGRIDKTKWSYNTALMIRTAIELYGRTNKPEYRRDLLEMRDASVKHWLGSRHELRDDGPFAFLLLEAWKMAGLVPAEDFTGPLTFIHENCRKDGFYGKRWEKAPPVDQTKFHLIDQAAAARAFFGVGRLVGGAAQMAFASPFRPTYPTYRPTNLPTDAYDFRTGGTIGLTGFTTVIG